MLRILNKIFGRVTIIWENVCKRTRNVQREYMKLLDYINKIQDDFYRISEMESDE